MMDPEPAISGEDVAPAQAPVRVLLVEDDDGDALLVTELFADVGEIRDVARARTLAEALTAVITADCVLLDMNLPDAAGFDGLLRLLEVPDHPAVVVLTGDVDETRGRAAVAAGAEDYLVKGRVDGPLLTRAVQYAVERRRADRLAGQLQLAQVHERENRRLGRGLLPTPLLRDRALTVTSRYQPGNAQLLLGGDFYDTVEIADGSVHAIVGDVSGHGPDEAAIGVSLRIAWRTLVLAGMPAEYVLPVLDQLLVTERHDAILFTTVAMISLPADRSHLDLYLAGHPAPLLIDGTTPSLLPDRGLGLPLGVRLGTTWPAVRVPLPREWALLLYTDGLIEARDDRGDVLWTDGLVDLLGGLLNRPTWKDEPGAVLDQVLAAVDARMPLRTDDLAVALLTHTPAVEQRRVWDHEPTAESCVEVRREIAAFLQANDVDQDRVDDAVLVAYELAMNAADHARTPFRLTAVLGPHALRLEVTDGSAAPPQVRPVDAHALRGRGLRMVDSIVESWTVHHDGAGKTIVADLTLDG